MYRFINFSQRDRSIAHQKVISKQGDRLAGRTKFNMKSKSSFHMRMNAANSFCSLRSPADSCGSNLANAHSSSRFLSQCDSHDSLRRFGLDSSFCSLAKWLQCLQLVGLPMRLARFSIFFFQKHRPFQTNNTEN